MGSRVWLLLSPRHPTPTVADAQPRASPMSCFPTSPALVFQARGEAGLDLDLLNRIFSSQQQQEALPDETEVVEETVAEVSEVGGW